MSTDIRHPPANILAERSVLGAIMSNPKAFDMVGVLLPEHFASPANARVFEEQRRIVAEGGIPDLVTLVGRLKTDPIIEAAGPTFMVDLINSVVGIINTSSYSKQIIDLAARRTMIDIFERGYGDAFDVTDGAGPDELRDRYVAELEGLRGPDADRKGISLNDAMAQAMTRLQQAIERGGPAGLMLGFAAVDRILLGLEDGTLNILAGRPGMGKSALGFLATVNVARQGIGVSVISLEMSAEQLGRRILASMARVPLEAMRTGRVSNAQVAALVQAQGELRDLPLTIDDVGGLSTAQIDMRVRSAHRRHGVGLIMVDHLHIIRPDEADERGGPTNAITKVSGALKAMAKRHNVPVLALAQMSRAVEAREQKRPTLADLRQSGSIEQDADTVSFVYREEYYMDREPTRAEGETTEKFANRLTSWNDRKAEVAGKAEVIVAKGRDGGTGTATLRFDGATTTFYDLGDSR